MQMLIVLMYSADFKGIFQGISRSQPPLLFSLEDSLIFNTPSANLNLKFSSPTRILLLTVFVLQVNYLL